MEERSERRKFERHCVMNEIRGENGKRPFQILDISLGGLAFSYDSGNKPPEDAAVLAKMLFPQDELCLDVLPVKPVSDCELASGPEGKRRCSVCFDKVTPAQKRMLQYFIWLHTRHNGSAREAEISL